MEKTTENKEVKLKVCLEEYSALRNEIISISEQSRNIWIAMITIYITLFIFSIEASAHYLLLVTYILLIPFQCILNSHKWSIQKISTYIRCFFEYEDTGIHWENMHIFPPYLKYRENHGDQRKINTMIATILGALSTLFYIYKICEMYNWNFCAMKIGDVLLLILSIGLLIVLYFINKQYTKQYDKDIMEIILKYKEDLKNMKG